MTDDDLRIVAQLAHDTLAQTLVLRGHTDLARRYLEAKDGEAIPMSHEEKEIFDEAHRRRAYTTVMEQAAIVKVRE
jgi:hypothetical protein